KPQALSSCSARPTGNSVAFRAEGDGKHHPGIARRIEVAPGKWRIDKSDDRGRTVDVHALRHTFGTLLSKGGAAPRTAQAAMRHSTIDLTMNVYTDPKLLDVHGAMDSLPAMPLDGERQSIRHAVMATGTDDLPTLPL